MRNLIITAVLVLGGCTHSTDIEITQRPIVFDEQREQLSLDYMKNHYGMVQEKATIDPKMVVVHWTVVPTLEKTFNVFNPPTLGGGRKDLNKLSALNVSAHFLVDRDGSIVQLLPTTTFARHVIGLNHTAIGIENIADGDTLPLTQAQIEANIKLISYLSAKHDIDYVIGHHEYQRFIGHELWKELNPDYLTEKSDPGDENMRIIRQGLSHLELKPLP